MKTLELNFKDGDFNFITLLAERSPHCNVEDLIKHLLVEEFNRVINYDSEIKKAWEDAKKNAIKKLNGGE